MKQLMIYW